MPGSLFILNGPPHGDERTYNGLRLAGALAGRGNDVHVFLMGDAAPAAKSGQHDSSAIYDIEAMMKTLVDKGTPIKVCGSCLDSRGVTADQLIAGTQRGTLSELADWSEQAETVLVF